MASIGEKIKYRLLLGFCQAVGKLPTWLLYHGILDFAYFLIYKVFRYRVKVVRQNLSEAFPEKTAQELRYIERRYYLHLAEVIMDTVDMSNITHRELDKRMRFEDIARHEECMEGRNWIAALAHYGSWEYFSAYQLHTATQVVGVYRPLHDKAFDMFYAHCRSRFGLKPVAMNDVLRYIVGHEQSQGNYALGLIADQSAKVNEKTRWFDFLNHKTLFYSGVEKLALRFRLPVYYMDVKKYSRVRYSARFVMIWDGEEEVRDGEITERYVRKLEETIRREPQYWMWSHKRWKYNYPGEQPEKQY